MQIVLRIIAGLAGALLLYVAFFLYEDEEARIQNRLEQIWKRIDALQSSAMSKEVAFLQGATRTQRGPRPSPRTQTAFVAIRCDLDGLLAGVSSSL